MVVLRTNASSLSTTLMLMILNLELASCPAFHTDHPALVTKHCLHHCIHLHSPTAGHLSPQSNLCWHFMRSLKGPQVLILSMHKYQMTTILVLISLGTDSNKNLEPGIHILGHLSFSAFTSPNTALINQKICLVFV